jgi:thiol-disulfide isomerase/thioredoxin
MSKAVRIRQQSAREKIAAQQASARRGDQRRKIMIAGGSAALVLVIVVALVIVKLAGGSGSPTGTSGNGTSAGSTNVAASVSHKIATVPAGALNKVGAGPAYPATGSVYPNAVKTIKTGGPLLTSNGKPEIVYVGGEYCPYCAAERWALSVALSRFGTFAGLRLIHSSSTDADPNTPTLSFYKSTYQSKYLTFAPTEAQDVNRAPLQPLTALDKSLMTKYDAPPYVPKAYSGSFPFVDFGNRYVIDGASYDPAVLANLTWQQIAADLAKPSSTVARAIDGSANHITAAICKITHNQPGAVCTSTGVTSASGSI